MAQKAAKQTARRNTQILNRTHLISAGVNAAYFLSRVLFRRGLAPRSLLTYTLLSLPGFFIEFWLERIGRPKYVADGKELRNSGEDLEAKGLTEFMWDVLYWTWGCVFVVGLWGDKAWWLWTVIPLYSGWLGYTTFGGMRQNLGGMGNQGTGAGAVPQSNRQKKMEKRGGQKTQYR